MSDINGVSIKKLTIGRETNEEKNRKMTDCLTALIMSR